MMIGYDIWDCFTMEHFRLRERMTLTTVHISIPKVNHNNSTYLKHEIHQFFLIDMKEGQNSVTAIVHYFSYDIENGVS
jgi:hypothetical protein